MLYCTVLAQNRSGKYLQVFLRTSGDYLLFQESDSPSRTVEAFSERMLIQHC